MTNTYDCPDKDCDGTVRKIEQDNASKKVAAFIEVETPDYKCNKCRVRYYEYELEP